MRKCNMCNISDVHAERKVAIPLKRNRKDTVFAFHKYCLGNISIKQAGYVLH